ncbi:unnamed protein product, partial [Adineta steineri]
GFCGTAKTCVAQCQDGTQDGAETDMDCGGGTCPACADGLKCSTGSDCTNAVCGTAKTCV